MQQPNIKTGGFRLTKWISNDKHLLNAIPPELRAQSLRTIREEGTLPTERALGVILDIQIDAFLFKIKPKELADTRRKVISLTASIFHPIGFLAPFIVRAKIFLQSLWKLRQGWDEKVREEIQQEWSEGTAESSRVLSTTVLSPWYGFSHLHSAVLVW